MGDNRVPLGEIQESGDRNTGSQAVEDARSGSEDYTQQVKNYYEARKNGMRDAQTREHLPPQPEFFDSETVDAQTSLKNDQGVVHLDDKDRVVAVEQPDGDKITLEYDKNDSLTKVNLPDEGKWEKNKDGSWNRFDKDGNKVDTLDGEIAVSQDGDLALIDKPSGTTQISHPDGSHTYIDKDNSQLTRDADGKITSVTHPDGKTAKISYDDNGNMKKLGLPDGGAWEKKEQGGWQRKDKNGKVVDNLDGDIALSDDGDIALMDNNGETQISHRNGDRTVQHADQSQMTTDAEGKVKSVTHPDGKTGTMEYDDKGELKTINLPDQGKWEKDPGDGKWRRSDADGKVIDTLDGDIQVSSKGDVVLADNDGTILISHLDGTQTKAQVQ